MKAVGGVDPLNYFNPISSHERGSALGQELTLGVLGPIGKVGTKTFHGIKRIVNAVDSIGDTRDVYESKRNVRF